MSVWEATYWSLVRACSVGFVVAIIVSWVFATLTSLRPRSPNIAIVILTIAVAPLIVPGLLIGYAYRPEGLRWVITPWKADLLHGVLSVARIMPCGLLVAWIVGVAPAGRIEATWEQARNKHCSWQHAFGRFRNWCQRRRGLIAAALIAAIWTFGEAEIAALLQARGWTEWTFRKLAGGWETSTIAASLWPVFTLTILAICAIGKIFTARSGNSRIIESRLQCAPTKHIRIIHILPVTATVVLLCTVAVVVPLSRLAISAFDGMESIGRQPSFWNEVGHTLSAAFVGTTVSLVAANLIIRRSRASIVALPFFALGVCGPMLASVVLQSIGFVGNGLSVIPQYTALTAVLLPIAVALQIVVQRESGARATKVTRQLTQHEIDNVRKRARSILWRISTAPRIAAWGFLFWIAFWDLQTAALLAPPGWATAPGRLYNLAHYGQSQTLAAMLLFLSVVAFAIPALVLTISLIWHRR